MVNCPVCNNSLQDSHLVCPYCGYRLPDRTMEFVLPENATIEYAFENTAIPTHSILRIIRGPQSDITFSLNENPLSIGRNPSCEVFLNDMTVSRQHAIIDYDGAFHCIHDCKSYNGVWVNNVNVTSLRLHSGDLIQIGSFSMVYEQE